MASRRRAAILVGLTVLGMSGGVVALWPRPRPDPDRLWAEARDEFAAGQHDTAAATLVQVEALREPTTLDLMLKAQLAMAEHREVEALALLARVPDTFAGAAGARLQAGQIELRRNRMAAAEDHFRRALQLDPELIQARKELIYIYGMQTRRAPLAEQFRALSIRIDLSYDQVFTWCLTRGATWDPVEQETTLGRYVAAEPSDRWSRLALAENQRRLQRFPEAETTLAPLRRDDPEVKAIRARIALDRSDDAGLETLLAEGKGDHDHVELAGLRARRALQRRDLAAALRHYRAAVALGPEDRDALEGLGRTLIQTGQAAEAAPLLEKVRRLDALNSLIQRAATQEGKADPSLVLKLGGACEAAGRRAEARAWYRLAIAHDPLDRTAQAALFRLRSEPEPR